jgi:hypothetical protein
VQKSVLNPHFPTLPLAAAVPEAVALTMMKPRLSSKVGSHLIVEILEDLNVNVMDVVVMSNSCYDYRHHHH